jgi:hypothetical protein
MNRLKRFGPVKSQVHGERAFWCRLPVLLKPVAKNPPISTNHCGAKKANKFKLYTMVKG